VTFAFAGVMMLVAAAASWMRGRRFVHVEAVAAATTPAAAASEGRTG
jgi:hypothetical protein